MQTRRQAARRAPRAGLSLLTAVAAVTLALGGLTACGGGDSDADGDEAQEQELESAAADAADQTVCVADATALTAPYDDRFPSSWTFPADTVVYDVEDRGTTGVIVTAVSSAPFDDVLDHLNEDEQQAGFEITGGETEENDAEANWTSTDFTGRWAIRKSASCEGETVIQVLATPAG